MVNVNTQVSSSMEHPFGEYTRFCFNVQRRDGGVWQLLASSFLLSVCAAAAWLQSSAGSHSEWKCHCHLRLQRSHGCNPGGVSEIWRLLKKGLGAGPDGDDGTEGLSLRGFHDDFRLM